MPIRSPGLSIKDHDEKLFGLPRRSGTGGRDGARRQATVIDIRSQAERGRRAWEGVVDRRWAMSAWQPVAVIRDH